MKKICIIIVLLFIVLAMTACSGPTAPAAAATPAEESSPFYGRFTSHYAGQYIYVFVDEETGVCYMWRKYGYGGGLTVMVNPDGSPMIYEEGKP